MVVNNIYDNVFFPEQLTSMMEGVNSRICHLVLFIIMYYYS